MRAPFCQTEEAFRDTLILKSEGFAFDRIAALYSLPRIQVIGREYWRRLAHAAALGPRDRPGTLWAAVEALFDQWAEPLLTRDVQIVAGGASITSLSSSWTCAHVGRLIRVGDYGLFLSTGLSGFGNIVLDLAPVASAQWSAPSWSVTETVSAKVLPFWVRDEGAVYEVLIDGELFSAPPTYLLPPPASDPRPINQPIGGELVSDPTIEGSDHRGIYLTGEEIRGLLQRVLDQLCAAGVRVVLRSLEGCSTSALGLGSLASVSELGRVGLPGVFIPPVEWS